MNLKLVPLKSFPQIYVDCDSSNTLLVMDTLLRVMNKSLPVQNIPSTMIIFDENSKSPICIKESNLISLVANRFSWSQISYQLAHEMCHRIIPSSVAQNLRWLEESICELSSYYFLPKLSEYWKSIGLNLETADGELYYPYFKSYVEENSKKATIFEVSQLCQIPKTQTIKDLEVNPYLRNINAHIANSLLPIFQTYPCTWNAVPLLYKVSGQHSLSSALQEWIRISPRECHDGLIEISHLFGLSESIL